MANRVLTDHDEIRAWAEARGGKPAQVRRTARGDEPGIIRLDFPGYSGEDTLEEIEWDEWFRKFDESGLALVVQERTRGGQLSNFNKLVGRETAAARARGIRTNRRALRSGGARRGAAARSGGKSAGRTESASTSARRRTGAKTGRATSRKGTATRSGGRTTAGRKTARAESAARTARGRGGATRGKRTGAGASRGKGATSRSTSRSTAAKTGSRRGVGRTRRGSSRGTRRR